MINRLQLVENQKVFDKRRARDLNSCRGETDDKFRRGSNFLLPVCRVDPLEAGHLYISLRVEGIKEEVQSWITLKGSAHYAKKFFSPGLFFSSIIWRQEVSAINSHPRDRIRQLRLELILSRECILELEELRSFCTFKFRGHFSVNFSTFMLSLTVFRGGATSRDSGDSGDGKFLRSWYVIIACSRKDAALAWCSCLKAAIWIRHRPDLLPILTLPADLKDPWYLTNSPRKAWDARKPPVCPAGGS